MTKMTHPFDDERFKKNRQHRNDSVWDDHLPSYPDVAPITPPEWPPIGKATPLVPNKIGIDYGEGVWEPVSVKMTEPDEDLVNNPKHYKLKGMDDVEWIDVIEEAIKGVEERMTDTTSLLTRTVLKVFGTKVVEQK